jgi:pyruvate/2-oxoglutarate/acetoin dehydrogenase E1 component
MAVITIREASSKRCVEMLRDERVFIMGEDIGAYGGAYAVTRGLLDEFGERIAYGTPHAEAPSSAWRWARRSAGRRPIAELMTINFSLLAMDQIVKHAAKMHHMFGGH